MSVAALSFLISPPVLALSSSPLSPLPSNPLDRCDAVVLAVGQAAPSRGGGGGGGRALLLRSFLDYILWSILIYCPLSSTMQHLVPMLSAASWTVSGNWWTSEHCDYGCVVPCKRTRIGVWTMDVSSGMEGCVSD